MVNPEIRSSLWISFRNTVLNLGGDPQKILDKAGLTSLEIEHPELLMQSRSFRRLLNVAAEETESEYFSLHLSSRMDLSYMGTLGLLLQNTDTVEEALKALIRCHPFVRQPPRICRASESSAWCTGLYSPGKDSDRF